MENGNTRFSAMAFSSIVYQTIHGIRYLKSNLPGKAAAIRHNYGLILQVIYGIVAPISCSRKIFVPDYITFSQKPELFGRTRA
jgi:hypothetical protein